MQMKCWVCAVLALISLSSLWAVPPHDSSKTTPRGLERPVFAEEVKEEDIWTARMGDKTSSSNYRQLFIYTPEKLTNVEFHLGEAEGWEKLKAFSTPDQFAYGTENFLPSAPGQKFTVRGINQDGKRVTKLVTVESADGLKMSVKTIKVEDVKTIPVSTPVAPVATSRVLQLAQSNIGRTVGSGDCSALRGGQRLGTIGGGGAGIERLSPGNVLRLSPNSSLVGSMGRFNVSSMGHYIVVESVRPDGTITFLDQNWSGGSSAGRRVRRATANLRTLNGSATIYSGD